MSRLVLWCLLSAGWAQAEPQNSVETRLVGVALASAGPVVSDGHADPILGPGFGIDLGWFTPLRSSELVSVGFVGGYRRYLDTLSRRQSQDSMHALSLLPTLRVGRFDPQTWKIFGEVALGYTCLSPDDPVVNDAIHSLEMRLGGGAQIPLRPQLSLQIHMALVLGAGVVSADRRNDNWVYTDGNFAVQTRVPDVGLGLAYRF